MVSAPGWAFTPRERRRLRNDRLQRDAQVVRKMCSKCTTVAIGTANDRVQERELAVPGKGQET